MEIKLEYFVPAIQIAGQVRIRCKDIYVNLFDLPFSNGFDRLRRRKRKQAGAQNQVNVSVFAESENCKNWLPASTGAQFGRFRGC